MALFGGNSRNQAFASTASRKPPETSLTHPPDPIVNPERLFEDFENLMPTGHTQRLLRIVIICHIMKVCP
jgi:hypothetical protein